MLLCLILIIYYVGILFMSSEKKVVYIHCSAASKSAFLEVLHIFVPGLLYMALAVFTSSVTTVVLAYML